MQSFGELFNSSLKAACPASVLLGLNFYFFSFEVHVTTKYKQTPKTSKTKNPKKTQETKKTKQKKNWVRTTSKSEKNAKVQSVVNAFSR